jgi:hypothetical protein
MTNDDAKYREWWEKLKWELATDDLKDKDAIHPMVTVCLVLRRMIQIENEAPK